MLPTAKAENYFRLTAEIWRGVNNEIAAIRGSALSKMTTALANAGTLDAARREAEEIQASCEFMVREAVDKGQRADSALQSTYKFDHE